VPLRREQQLLRRPHLSLARYGHDRDGPERMPIIVYGLMTDREGPSHRRYRLWRHTGDPTTVADQVNKLRERFSLVPG